MRNRALVFRPPTTMGCCGSKEGDGGEEVLVPRLPTRLDLSQRSSSGSGKLEHWDYDLAPHLGRSGRLQRSLAWSKSPGSRALVVPAKFAWPHQPLVSLQPSARHRVRVRAGGSPPVLGCLAEGGRHWWCGT